VVALVSTQWACSGEAAAPRSAPRTTVPAVVTVGSMAEGSRQLKVESAQGFALGDWVIVEIGKEAGQGRRGTRGVGGTWPSKSYPTEAALLADKSQPDRLHAWAEDTGYAFLWLRGEWLNMAPNRPNVFYTGQYYVGKAIPKSLQARITAIEGNVLTLDKPAVVSTSGANVYLDVAPILNEMIAKSRAVALPEGKYPTGGVVWVRDKASFELAGKGKDATTIYSPKGVPSAMILVHGSPDTVVRDLTLQGNFRDEGFGLNWTGSTPAGPQAPVTDYALPQGGAFPRGVAFMQGSHNGIARDLRVIDVAQQAVGVAFSNNVWARRVQNVQNDLMRQYVQWQFQWTDTTGGGCEDCEVVSKYILPGFEAFKATDVRFIRPKGLNALVAMNGAGGWTIEDGVFRFTAGSLHPDSDKLAASPFHGIINVNTGVGVTPQVAKGGIIRDTIMVQDGYLNDRNDTLKGIVVNDQNRNVRIERVSYIAPDFKEPSKAHGARGLDSTAEDTVVNGMVVVGKAQPNYTNIFVRSGRGVNCSGLVVEGCARAK
jgi:hypothetical protein